MQLNNLDFEVKRKIFHFLSILFPITYLFTTKLTMVILLIIVTGIALSIDISRHYNPQIQELVEKFFSEIMRKDETNGNFKLSGVSYTLLGFFITCVLFSKGTAIASFLVLIISDTLAAMVGKKFGNVTENGKSLEGSMVFGVSAIFIGMLAYTFEPYISSFLAIIIASIATTLAEYYSNKIKINDNLLIPVIYGFTITLIGLL